MTATKTWLIFPASVLILGFSVVIALSVGIVQLSPAEVLRALFSSGAGTAQEAQATAVIWSIRFPRAIVAMLVGAALAVAGVVMQALLRNPLADPGVTGVSAGAAVGAVAGIVLGFAGSLEWGVPLAAFLGASLVTLVLHVVLKTRRESGPGTLILVGVSLNAFAGALISVIIANARDDATARGALFWLAGDLELRGWNHVLLAVVPIIVGIAYLCTRIRALDALSLGEHIAATSGINVHRERAILLVVTSLIVGAAVAVSGIISFVGLVVPHALRLIVGASHAVLLPLSVIVGAVFLVLLDSAARTMFEPAVLQTGVVCALVGAPVFLALVLARSRS